jgi:hypothetical protein
MTEKNFDWVVEKTLDNIRNILVIKGKEYRRFSNPFHNFEEAAKVLNTIREDALWGFATKHYISIQDIKTDLRAEGKLPSKAMIEEKYNDLIIYLMLEKASLIDRIQIKENNFDKEDMAH